MARKSVRSARSSPRGSKVDVTKNFRRHRVRDPKQFRKGSFRTVDIGKPGRHKLIRGRDKRTGKFKTQAVIVEKGSGAKASDTRKIIARARRE